MDWINFFKWNKKQTAEEIYFRDLFEVHKKQIVECLDPDFGLLDELLSNQSLLGPEVAKVRAVADSYGRSEKLLEYVSDKGIFEKFLDALKKTNQIHLENFILSNGERSPCFWNEWPLTERELSILSANHSSLVEKLETSDLILHLYSQKVVNNRQKEFVSSKTTSHEKNQAFLEILRRTSLGNYEKTIHYLHSLRQSHISKLLKESGADTKKVLDLRHMSIAKYCFHNKTKALDNYCTDCKRIVCILCDAENHKLHDCKNVEEFRQTIKRAAWKTSNCVHEMLSLKKNADKEKVDFFKRIEMNEAAIRKRNQELKDMIDRQTDSLLNELSVIKSGRLKDVKYQLEEIEGIYTILRGFETYCNELTSNGSAIDIFSSVDQVITNAEKLQKHHEAFIGRPHKSFEVAFKTTEAEDNLKNANYNFVGNIGVSTKSTARLLNFAVVVGFNDEVTMTKDVVKINLCRPHEISSEEQIPTIMQKEAIAAVYCNAMYVVGLGVNYDEIWKYSVITGWLRCAYLVQGRRRHSAAFFDEVLYICGGFVDSDGSVLDSVEAYNAVTDKCTVVGKLVHCVESSGNCVPFKSSIYIFGGTDKDKKSLNDIQVYNTKENTCSVLLKPMPRPYNLMRAVQWETSVILLGYYTCFIFNLETETWQERRQFKTDVVHFGLVLENDRIFVIGGGDSETDKDGKTIWKCRDDVRYVSLQNIIDNKAIEWNIHATLPKPSLVHVNPFASMQFSV